MIVYIPILASLIGLVIYAITANPKAQAIALHVFWTGLLVFFFQCAALKIFP